MKSIVITGVSSGIGLESTKKFTRHGYRVFGSVRSEKDAAKIQKEVGANFIPLIFDITDEAAIKKAAQFVAQETNNKGLSGLINNAGIAITGPLMHLPINDMRKQLEVNVIGVLAATQAFLPMLGAKENYSNNPGKIINISSVSGKIGYPFAGAYAASKHALEAISQSLRRELLIYGIDVIIIGPGSVTTPIWEKDPVKNVGQKYSKTDYGPILESFKLDVENSSKHYLKAEFVATEIFKIFHLKHPKTRYPIYSGKIQSWIVHNLLTDRMLDYFIKKKVFKM